MNTEATKRNFIEIFTNTSGIIDLSVRAFGLIVVVYLFNNRVEYLYLTVPLMILILFGAFVQQQVLLKSPVFWFSVSTLLLLNIIVDWYHPANHHFLLFYVCTIIGFTFLQKKDEQIDFISTNFRLVLIILMFFASIQKLFSPTFIDGSFFGYILLKGGFLEPFLAFSSSYQEWTEVNYALIKSSSNVDPNLYLETKLIGNSSLFRTICKFSSYMIFVVEFVVFYILIAVESRIVRQVSLILLIAAIFITRLECGFLSILCGVGLAQCDIKDKKIIFTYLVLILIFSTLIVVDLAFS